MSFAKEEGPFVLICFPLEFGRFVVRFVRGMVQQAASALAATAEAVLASS
jgi:hypothetical protein